MHMRYCLFLLLLCSVATYAQKLPGIEEKTTGLKKYEGYIPFYWDENMGRLWLEIPRTDSEFLYQTSLPAGLGSNDIGLDRGQMCFKRGEIGNAGGAGQQCFQPPGISVRRERLIDADAQHLDQIRV